MNEKDPNEVPDTVPQITVNELGLTKDPTVVVDEKDRTVLLTPDETVVIEKPTAINIIPANRPREVYKGMWGTPELAAAAVSMLAIFSVLAFYIFVVVPSNNELELARAERDKLERERNEAQAKYGNITSTQQRVADLITSVDDFERNHLPMAANGRTAVYQRINSLISGYGLTNTSGPTYAPLEMDPNRPVSVSETETTTGRDRYLSLFPGIYVSMTVEGPYANIRRFIREIETGRDFVLISSVEIEPADVRQRRQAAEQATADVASQDPTRQVNPNFGSASRFPNNPTVPNQPASARPPQGRTMGDVVSLRLELAAYFRRMNAAAVPAMEGPQ